MTPDLVSIVIVSWNRKEDLRCCLATIYQQKYPHLEVLVFDCGSSDGTSEQISREYPQVRLYRSDHNVGTCVSRNAGIKLCRGEFVWFLDSDTEIADPNLLSTLTQLLKTFQQIGALGGEGLADEVNRVVGVKTLTFRSNGVCVGERLTDLPKGSLESADVLATCNFFTRKTLLEEVGGFDPWYFFYLEDIDLSLRIKALGYTLNVIGKIPLIHKFSDVSRRISIPHIARNRLYLVLKHLPIYRLFLLPLYDLLYFLDIKNFGRFGNFMRLKRFRTKGLMTQPSNQPSGGIPLSALPAALRKSFEIFLWLGSGYLLILPNIRRPLQLRANRQDYLDPSNLSAFRKISPASTPTSS